MERNVTREGICETNVCNFVSKSSIGPTSVEFASAIQKKETDKCRHFSIRAYVSEIRRKDLEICWPFSSLGDNEESKKQADMLPPLHVPEFRWWDCQNCLQRSDASDDAAHIKPVSNSSADKVCESINSDVNTSVELISSKLCPVIHDHMKEKVPNVMSIIRQVIPADVFTSGYYNNTVVKDVDKTIKEPICFEMKNDQCVNGELTKDAETINLNLEGCRLVELGEANCGTNVVDEVVLKCANNRTVEVFQKEKLVIRVSKVAKTSEQVEEIMCHKKLELGTLDNEVVDSLIGLHRSQLHPRESRKNDDYNDAHDLHVQFHADRHGDSIQTLSSRKPQKFRLLTDIIRGEVSGDSTKIYSSNGTKNSDHVNAKVTPTKAADKTDSLGLDIHSGGWVAVQENVEKDTGGKNKKRKALQAEDPEPLQLRWSKSVSENIRNYKKDQKNNCFDTETANSISVNGMSLWEGLNGGFRSRYSEDNTHGKDIGGMKNKKKTQFEHREPYLEPWQDGLCRELQLGSREVESTQIGAGALQLSNDGSTESGLHPSLCFNLASKESNKKSTFCMKENNILDDAQATLMPLQEAVQIQDQVIRHDEEHNQVGAAISPFRSAMDAFTGIGTHPGVFSNNATHRKAVVGELQTNMTFVKHAETTGIIPAKTAQNRKSEGGLHTSVNFCMASERRDTESTLQNHKQGVPQVGSGKTSVIIHHEGMPKKDQLMCKEMEVKHAETTGMSVRYATNVSSGRGVLSGLKNIKATLRKASTSIKQNIMSQVQDGASPIWSKDLPFIYNSENNMNVQGHSEAIRKQSNKRADRMGELEALNDIPIEIVELLAKNRHERRRLEAENANWNKFSMSETTKNVKDAEKNEFSGVHKDDMSRYLWDKNLQMHKPQSSNSRGGMSAAGRNVSVEPVEELIAYSSHLKQTCKSIGSNIKHLGEPHDSKGSFVFSASPVNHSSGNQFTEAGTCRNFCAPSYRWDEDMLGCGWPISCLQCLPSHPKSRIVSSPTRIRGAHHVSLPNVADDHFGIESSQKFATLSQRQNRNFHFEIFKNINAVQPCACTQKKIGNFQNHVGPSDLYTNETMPATQLLKLMDAGMSSRISDNVAENTGCSNQLTFAQTNHRKELLPLHGGVLKDTSKQSLSICLSKDYRVGKSGERFPSVPISDAAAFLVQRDKNCVGSSRIMGQVSQKMGTNGVKSRRRTKRKSSYSPMQAADCKLLGSGSESRGLGKSQEFFPINALRAEFHSPSNSMIMPLKSHLVEGSTGNIEVDKVGTVSLVKGSCQTDICSINRNPADFSIPEAGNEFMIGGGDLKCRKIISKRGRPRLRMMKLVALKEPEQN